MGSRRRFTSEFKREAVKLTQQPGAVTSRSKATCPQRAHDFLPPANISTPQFRTGHPSTEHEAAAGILCTPERPEVILD